MHVACNADSLQGSQINSESLEEESGNRNGRGGMGIFLLSAKKVNSKEELLFQRKDREEKIIMG